MIRLMSIVPLLSVGGDKGFREQPLTAGSWREFATLTDEQRTILRDQHGTWLRVHPHDQEALKRIGLDFARDTEGRPKLQEPLVELKAKASKPPIAADTNKTEDEDGKSDPVATTNTETPADLAGKSKRKDR